MVSHSMKHLRFNYGCIKEAVMCRSALIQLFDTVCDAQQEMWLSWGLCGVCMPPSHWRGDKMDAL